MRNVWNQFQEVKAFPKLASLFTEAVLSRRERAATLEGTTGGTCTTWCRVLRELRADPRLCSRGTSPRRRWWGRSWNQPPHFPQTPRQPSGPEFSDGASPPWRCVSPQMRNWTVGVGKIWLVSKCDSCLWWRGKLLANCTDSSSAKKYFVFCNFPFFLFLWYFE